MKSVKKKRELRSKKLDDSGFIILCLTAGLVDVRKGDLISAATGKKRLQLVKILRRLHLNATPLITAVAPEFLLQAEEEAKKSEFPPVRSLTQYWRLDSRPSNLSLREIEHALRDVPGIESVYCEKATCEPGNLSVKSLSSLQRYLNAAPVGIDVRWVRKNFPGVDGKGLHFIDVEEGWLPAHEDLPPIEIIYGDNHRGSDPDFGYHGAAVLGIVAGLDNKKGIKGILPNLASIRGASLLSKSAPHKLHTADALCAAYWSEPRAHVVLIEVQLGTDKLPAETDDANFLAIRLLASRGITVVEAAGNGGQDLNEWIARAWSRKLDRTKADWDSGAIMVGAGESGQDHDRWKGKHAESNYGERVDCYAWGAKIVTVGGSADTPSARISTHYTKVFDGTSGASAIIAGGRAPSARCECFTLAKIPSFAKKNTRPSVRPPFGHSSRT